MLAPLSVLVSVLVCVSALLSLYVSVVLVLVVLVGRLRVLALVFGCARDTCVCVLAVSLAALSCCQSPIASSACVSLTSPLRVNLSLSCARSLSLTLRTHARVHRIVFCMRLRVSVCARGCVCLT